MYPVIQRPHTTLRPGRIHLLAIAAMEVSLTQHPYTTLRPNRSRVHSLAIVVKEGSVSR